MNLLAQLDQTAFATWAGVLVTAIAGGVASWGSVQFAMGKFVTRLDSHEKRIDHLEESSHRQELHCAETHGGMSGIGGSIHT